MPELTTCECSFADDHQEACYEGRTEAWRRDWRACPGEGIVQAFCRNKEADGGSIQTQASPKEEGSNNQEGSL